LAAPSHLPSVVAVIMGGGRGTRLDPLVRLRCKPAVPLAGRYRLIDVPISNCLHSGINRIFVLTQYNSRSLNNHVTRTYQFGPVSHGRVEIIAAAQSLQSEAWFQGTADAVRRCLPYIHEHNTSHVLVLSGDQLYAMNFQHLLRTHQKKDAELTVACKPVSRQDAPRFGIMRTDSDGRIVDFVEKPSSPEELERVQSSDGSYQASLGIYLFNREVLEQVLREVAGVDFGRDIIPYAVRGPYRVYAHFFSGYWEDIGTIKSFYHANLALAGPNPPLDLFSRDWMIYTRPRFLPPSKIENSTIDQALVADGCRIRGASVRNSVIGIRTVIREGSTIEDSIIMGADYFVPEPKRPRTIPVIGIGRHVVLRKAIVDKNVRIGNNVRIVNVQNLQKADGQGWCIRDGIVVVEKNAVIPAGTVI